ncbi:Mor transcription activator family protein [Lactiplantibacillus modestisalitolerans]|uniref:Mor transcription activator family protein n=1 Tax=Lactiplantibacillus modestisalitolerans TaxID=1457219 RepID=A0ABV5WRF6_9LACO|nr:Mor transcription activator family protein [Lactiplantibacillus modestisalitolerans]
MAKEVDVAALQTFYRGVSDLIGVDGMLKIYDQYRGMQLTLPIHMYDRELAAQQVIHRYNGHNSYQLANYYGYSQRWINQVIRAERADQD